MHGTGHYVTLDYPGSTVEGELKIAVTYTLWIPDGVKTLRGIIVHQHGAGMTASKEGSTAAYDLHWQALARKWDCALLGPCYQVRNEGDWGEAGSIHWFDPRRGSERTFLKALDDFAVKAEHPEIAKVPWALWGHSAGGIWCDVMCTLHPDRIIGVYLRSGSTVVFSDRPEQLPPPKVSDAVYGIPMVCNPGIKEKPDLVWNAMWVTFHDYRTKGGLIGFAPDPRTHHECGDSRYFAIPFLDACLAARLPDKWANDGTLKPMDTAPAWLAAPNTTEAVPAADYKGDPREAVWLPNGTVAKAWMEYVKTGSVGDATPPPTPFNLMVTPKGEQGMELTWDADADPESGLGGFIILRDGKEFAKVPETPIESFGRSLFQGKTYHDTPSWPLSEMRYLDTSAKPGEKHMYAIIAVNSAGLKSKPTGDAPWRYLRVDSAASYETDASWPERRADVSWGAMSGVSVDDQDNVWVLSRSNPYVLQYRADGKFLRSWGAGIFGSPHMLKLDRTGNVWVADTRKHVVMQCTPQGTVLRTLGTAGEAGCDEAHFDKPTDLTVTRGGAVYVSDGYGNARVVHFDKDGRFVKAWGKLGTAAGEFNLPHAITSDSQGRVYVADRNNARIQVFDRDGKFLDQWTNIVVPCALAMTRDDELWVGGTSPMTWRREDNMLGYPPKDQLFMRFDTSGKLLQLWSVPMCEDGEERPGNLNWCHSIAPDSRGNIYAVDVKGKRAQKFVLVPAGPERLH